MLISSFSIPIPLSTTSTLILLWSILLVFIVISPPLGIASIALIIKFENTIFNFSSSARIGFTSSSNSIFIDILFFTKLGSNSDPTSFIISFTLVSLNSNLSGTVNLKNPSTILFILASSFFIFSKSL